MMVQARLGEQVEHAARRTGLRITRTEYHARDAGMEHGTHAHHAGFQRDEKLAAYQPIVTEMLRRVAQRGDLGMGGRIMPGDGRIAAPSDDLAVLHHHRPDGHLARLCRLPCQIERYSHKAPVGFIGYNVRLRWSRGLQIHVAIVRRKSGLPNDTARPRIGMPPTPKRHMQLARKNTLRPSRRKFEREQTRGEEIANSLSHGGGLVAAIVATPFIILHARALNETRYLVGVSIFAASMILLYLGSTLYHALPPGKLKHAFRIIEHSAIYLLIAGTYTPFTLGVLYGPWGWTLLSLIWSLALVGVALKVLNRISHPVLSTALYLLMGWLILIAADPLFTRLPVSGIAWLVAGGLAYTAGTAFFAADARLRYGHFIWHLFVLMGTTCHYFAVYWYAA